MTVQLYLLENEYSLKFYKSHHFVSGKNTGDIMILKKDMASGQEKKIGSRVCDLFGFNSCQFKDLVERVRLQYKKIDWNNVSEKILDNGWNNLRAMDRIIQEYNRKQCSLCCCVVNLNKEALDVYSLLSQKRPYNKL